ncbi:hypothetical protein [Sphingomonas sp. LT1P40]|uniref:hypothetical protein n=1 Tax=Alteristakelama amylovorans TaxID=3096166 RepID=UPI002FC6ED00
MNWMLAAGSLAAVLTLAGIAWALRLGGTQQLKTGDDAVALAEALVSGFVGQAGVVSASGGLAAVAGDAGELVLIEPMGARFRARRIDGATLLSVTHGDAGAAITLQTGTGELFRITVADAEEARAFAAALDG